METLQDTASKRFIENVQIRCGILFGLDSVEGSPQEPPQHSTISHQLSFPLTMQQIVAVKRERTRLLVFFGFGSSPSAHVVVTE